MARVSLHEVSKAFGGVMAVDCLSMEIPDQTFVSLLGPSGCGKTTTLNLIAGLERTDRGRIELQGEDITDWAPHERQMAMVFQNYALYPHMNVYGNLAFALKLAKQPRREIDTRVRRVADLLEIGSLLDRRVGQLSGGQQQRVALARALVKEPQVFLFDEPLSNLDASLRTRMRVEIKKLHQQVRATSIFVTHDQEEAMMLSDLIVIMQGGHLVQIGSPDEIYRHPKNTYVATFVGKPRMNLIEGAGTMHDGHLSLAADGLTLSWPADPLQLRQPCNGRRILVGIRPEDLTLVEPTAASDTLAGEVALVEPLGPDTFVEVTRGPHSVTARVEPDRRLRLLDQAVVHLPDRKLHIFDAESGERLNA